MMSLTKFTQFTHNSFKHTLDATTVKEFYNLDGIGLSSTITEKQSSFKKALLDKNTNSSNTQKPHNAENANNKAIPQSNEDYKINTERVKSTKEENKEVKKSKAHNSKAHNKDEENNSLTKNKVENDAKHLHEHVASKVVKKAEISKNIEIGTLHKNNNTEKNHIEKLAQTKEAQEDAKEIITDQDSIRESKGKKLGNEEDILQFLDTLEEKDVRTLKENLVKTQEEKAQQNVASNKTTKNEEGITHSESDTLSNDNQKKDAGDKKHLTDNKKLENSTHKDVNVVDDSFMKGNAAKMPTQNNVHTIFSMENYRRHNEFLHTGAGKKVLLQLEKQGNDTLVQNAKLLLQQNGKGQVRLQLTPKELGEVKLFVTLDENNLVHTRAVVSSDEAKQAMQKNLGNLARQFAHEGYEIGSFSVSVNSDTSDNNNAHKHFSQFIAEKKYDTIQSTVRENIRSYLKMSEAVDFVA